MLSNRAMCLSVMDEDFRLLIISAPKMMGDMVIDIARNKLRLLSKPVLKDYKSMNESLFSDSDNDYLGALLSHHRDRFCMVIEKDASPIVVIERFLSFVDSMVIKSYMSCLELSSRCSEDGFNRIELIDGCIDSLVKIMNKYFFEIKEFVVELHESRMPVGEIAKKKIDEFDNKYTFEKKSSRQLGVFMGELLRDYRVYGRAVV